MKSSAQDIVFYSGFPVAMSAFRRQNRTAEPFLIDPRHRVPAGCRADPDETRAHYGPFTQAPRASLRGRRCRK